MLKIREIVENWPKSNHLEKYIPIAIAIIALAVSIYSAYFTQVSFVVSQRPYVWAMSYGYIDGKTEKFIPDPSRIAFRVLNSPAKILKQELKISQRDVILFSHSTTNEVHFPDERIEWTHSIDNTTLSKIKRQVSDQADLFRTVSIQYSSLDGGKTYSFGLIQQFDPKSNQWKDVKSSAE